jgi:hypothetical protein
MRVLRAIKKLSALEGNCWRYVFVFFKKKTHDLGETSRELLDMLYIMPAVIYIWAFGQ